MKLTAIKCPQCGDTLYARCDEDIRQCSCKSSGIDKRRIVWQPEIARPQLVDIELDTTRDVLYDDWNEDKNEYGLIKAERH